MGTRKLILLVVPALVGLLSNTSSAASPELCKQVVLTEIGQPYMDSVGQTISRWCEPHTDPPAWGSEVCCELGDEARCVLPDEGGCSVGVAYSCEYGEQIGDEVVCYQPGPDACEMGFCADEVIGEGLGTRVTTWLCCQGDIDYLECVWAGDTKDGDIPEVACAGWFTVCNWGWTNLDGTVSCLG